MCQSNSIGAEYFVSQKGSDNGPGSLAQPFATFKKAVSVLKAGDTCYIRAGVYDEVLKPTSSGTADAPITFCNYEKEKVVLTGAEAITGWKNEGKGVYSAAMTWNLTDGNQIFADGKMLSEAAWPAPGDEHLFKPKRAVVKKGSVSTLVCDQIPGGKDAWKGAHVWCAGGAAWICWSTPVTGYNDKTHTLKFELKRWTSKWYLPRKGNLFSLRGIRRALTAPGQWFYDVPKKRLLLIPPKGSDISKLRIEAKRRLHVIDLSGRSYINIEGVHFRAGGIKTDKESSHIVLKGLTGRYVSHSFIQNVGGKAGVLLLGNNCLLLNSDLGYSSASVVTVRGQDNRVINCNIHHGCYSGLFSAGTVMLSGRRTVFSHNTVRHAGRDLVNTPGLMESLVQYNDVSDAGWLTKDLGMFYGHNTDYAGTQFCYNLVHDNHAKHCAMGIYFDHLSHNAIVHHNIVWNVGMDPIRFNNPSYNDLVFNNTCWKSGRVGTFDHAKRNDLFACRYTNNIFNVPIRLPKHVVITGNLVSNKPPLKNPAKRDFRLAGTPQKNIGALKPGQAMWRVGCDFANPPNPLPVYKAPHAPWMNAIRNACFELWTIEGWEKTDAGKAKLTKGNGWGNSKSQKRLHMTGTSKHELQLGPGRDGVRQVVKGLSPNTNYTLSAWVRVSAKDEVAVVGVEGHGANKVTAKSNSTAWVRKSISFKTGPSAKEATVFLQKSSNGKGHVWCDNLTLPLTPAGM